MSAAMRLNLLGVMHHSEALPTISNNPQSFWAKFPTAMGTFAGIEDMPGEASRECYIVPEKTTDHLDFGRRLPSESQTKWADDSLCAVEHCAE